MEVGLIIREARPYGQRTDIAEKPKQRIFWSQRPIGTMYEK